MFYIFSWYLYSWIFTWNGKITTTYAMGLVIWRLVALVTMSCFHPIICFWKNSHSTCMYKCVYGKYIYHKRHYWEDSLHISYQNKTTTYYLFCAVFTIVNTSSIILSIFFLSSALTASTKQQWRCPSKSCKFIFFNNPITAKFCCTISIQYSFFSAMITILSNRLLAFLKAISCFFFWSFVCIVYPKNKYFPYLGGRYSICKKFENANLFYLLTWLNV